MTKKIKIKKYILSQIIVLLETLLVKYLELSAPAGSFVLNSICAWVSIEIFEVHLSVIKLGSLTFWLNLLALRPKSCWLLPLINCLPLKSKHLISETILRYLRNVHLYHIWITYIFILSSNKWMGKEIYFYVNIEL